MNEIELREPAILKNKLLKESWMSGYKIFTRVKEKIMLSKIDTVI